MLLLATYFQDVTKLESNLAQDTPLDTPYLLLQVVVHVVPFTLLMSCEDRVVNCVQKFNFTDDFHPLWVDRYIELVCANHKLD